MISHYIYMKTPSISLLSLLLALLIPLSTPWCYKNYMPLPSEVAKIDFSPDNAYMALVSINAPNWLLVYDLANYDLLLNYSVSGSTITSAKFTNDGIYLGVGLNTGPTGLVYLLSGRPPFSSTVNASFVLPGNIADIDFNTGNSKLLVCYSNHARYDIYGNYTGTLNVNNNITLPSNIIRCKFSANDDIAFIDTNKYLKIYKSTNSISSNVQVNGPGFKQLDVKNSTTTPIKFVGVGNDTKIFYNFDSPVTTVLTVSTSSTSNLANGQFSVVCYSGDLNYYASAAGGSDGRVYLISDSTNSVNLTFNDAINPNNYGLISCAFTRDGSYLFVGSQVNAGTGYLYIYKQNCY